MKILIGAVALAISLACLAGTPCARAYPGPDWTGGANCETNVMGALFCDGPIKPNGSWTRCMTYVQSPFPGGMYSPPIHRCYPFDPAHPPGVPLGQPPYRIGTGL